MSKVLTFSRVFPKGHIFEGDKTFFAEKFLRNFRAEDWFEDQCSTIWEALGYKCRSDLTNEIHGQSIKMHTIRKGERWKAGDTFSPRVWTGAPYRTPQIILAPDITIVNEWRIKMDLLHKTLMINGTNYTVDYDKKVMALASNDGLRYVSFADWFKEPIDGQIICWNKYLKY